MMTVLMTMMIVMMVTEGKYSAFEEKKVFRWPKFVDNVVQYSV